MPKYVYLQLGSCNEFFFVLKNHGIAIVKRPSLAKLWTQAIPSCLIEEELFLHYSSLFPWGMSLFSTVSHVLPSDMNSVPISGQKLCYYWCKLSPQWDRSTCATSVCANKCNSSVIECEQWFTSTGRFFSFLKPHPEQHLEPQFK